MHLTIKTPKIGRNSLSIQLEVRSNDNLEAFENCSWYRMILQKQNLFLMWSLKLCFVIWLSVIVVLHHPKNESVKKSTLHICLLHKKRIFFILTTLNCFLSLSFSSTAEHQNKDRAFSFFAKLSSPHIPWVSIWFPFSIDSLWLLISMIYSLGWITSLLLSIAIA